MIIENIDVEEMVRQTGIAAVTIEYALREAEAQPGSMEAEREAVCRFEREAPELRVALILYRRERMGSPLEYAIIRQIASRFFQKPPDRDPGVGS